MGSVRRSLILVWTVFMALMCATILVLALRPQESKLDNPNQCLSNVKQIDLGFLMYASDNDGMLPPQKGWDKALLPLIRSWPILVCPQDSAARNANPPEAARSYALNQSARVTLDYNRKPDPYANLPLVFDATALLGTQSVAAYRHPQKRWGFTHEGLNVGFCDGHVGWVERGEFEKMDMAP